LGIFDINIIMAHFYILYRINNKVNGKFYIGVHKTNNIHDDYFGSGHKIKAAIAKHGKENFEKEIIQVFTNGVEAFNKEQELFLFGSLTTTTDAPITGYITIKDASGATRKLAVIS